MHTFVHVEIPTLNTEKAAKFYGGLFGWKTEAMPGMDYLMISTADGQMIGGITPAENFPHNDSYINYIEVADIEQTLKKAVSLGGTAAMSKTPLPPPNGFIGKVISPDGYCIGLWSKE
jgi:predicted enzyme related to lactoylglutathione lyase